MPDFAKASATLAGLMLWLAATGSAAAAPPDATDRMVRSTVESRGSIFTDSERATIAARCGYGAEWNGRNVVMNDGVLICSDGRRVDDPEVRAITTRVSERVTLRVREALDSAGVARTMSRRTREEVRERMRHLRVQRPHLNRGARDAGLRLRQVHSPVVVVRQRLAADERARLHADIAQLREEMQQMRETIRRDVHERLRREGVH